MIAIVTVVSLTGCEEKSKPDVAAETLVDTVTRGPLSLTTTITPISPIVGDDMRVEMRFSAPPEYRAAFPTADAFQPLDTEMEPEKPPVLREDGTRESVAVYRIPVFSAGTLEIPALVVQYGKSVAGEDDAPLESEIASNPQKVEVAGVLTSQDSAAEPRDISAILSPPPEPLAPTTIAMYVGIALLVLAVLAGLILWLRRTLLRPAPPIPPHEWALRELSALQVEEAAGLEKIKLLYYRMSEIVREYIERQFSIAAPDMTTEEFLRTTAARRSGALPFDPQALAPFMEQCDIVKYAAYEAMPDDARAALATARSFVQATAQRAPVEGTV
ncbi:MAG: hypothetical protein AB7N71_00245 [Phycisphaerae bacterium]